MATIERLQAHGLVAEIAPEVGGSIAALYGIDPTTSARRDWLRPASADALATRSPLGMASFPLVPWCNRLRDGRFEWNGRQVQLAPNSPGSPHTIHGIGWQRPWRVTAKAEHWIELAFEDDGSGAWPFPFVATQRYELEHDGLAITLSMANRGTESMPAGIGHHPYFVHRREGAGTHVQAQVDAMWCSGADLLPTRLSSTEPAVGALRGGMPIVRFPLDNNFTGFGHASTATWPDGSSLQVRSAPPLDFFVLYTPSDGDVFVMEAVSNCTDWINLRHTHAPAEIGGTALAPGQTLSMTTRFCPRQP